MGFPLGASYSLSERRVAGLSGALEGRSPHLATQSQRGRPPMCHGPRAVDRRVSMRANLDNGGVMSTSKALRGMAVATLGEPRARCEWRRRVTVPLLSCVLVLAVSATPAVSLGSIAPRCTTSHLRLSLVRELGAAGARSWDLGLRNVGSATCRLYGYPGVGLLNRHGQRMSVNVVRDTTFRPKTVIVHHNQRAYFTFIWESAGPCEPHFFTAYGLAVFPSNSTHQLFLRSLRLEICDTSIGGPPRVTPVRHTLDGL
jgi:hypothetical protein